MCFWPNAVWLRRRLDSFGDCAHVQAARHPHGGINQNPVGMAGVGLAGEGTVNLDRVHWQQMQACQGRIAGSGIVQCQHDTQRPELVQTRLHIAVLRGQAFGHLELKALWFDPVLKMYGLHPGDEARFAQLGARQVDGKQARRAGPERALPDGKLPDCFRQYERAQGYDQAAVFGDANELHRRNEPTRRMWSTYQGLDAGVPVDRARRAFGALETHHRLVRNPQLPFRQRGAQLRLQLTQ